MGQLLDIDLLQQFLDRLGAHTGAEVVLVFLIVAVVLLLGEKLFLLQGGRAGINDDIPDVVKHPLEQFRRHIEQKPHPGRNGAEIPDVGDRGREFDVTHPLAAHLLGRDLDVALFADLADGTHALVLAAHTLPVLGRPEDPLAEETADLRLQGAVVDGLRLGHLAVRPAADHFGRRQTDLNGIKNVSFHKTVLFPSQLSICVIRRRGVIPRRRRIRRSRPPTRTPRRRSRRLRTRRRSRRPRRSRPRPRTLRLRRPPPRQLR